MAGLSDAEFLGLAVASESLAGVDSTVRDMHRKAAWAKVLAPVAKKYDPAAINSAVYVTPVATPPVLLTGDAIDAAGWFLKGLAADIGGFTILGHRGISQQDATYQVVKDRHDAAIAWLAKVTDGEGAELPGLEPTRGGPQVANGPAPRWRSGALGVDCEAPWAHYTGIDIGDGES